jgi:exodeoxyribonuclease VII large subunit
MAVEPLKVCEVNQYIKRVLSSDPILHNIRVEGEISNFKHHYSGHLYFSLKDDKSKLNCVMFDGNCKGLNFEPQDGMSIVASGYISVYERNGNYQLYVKEMSPKGIGELYEEFEKLKKRLESEGLFDKKYKKTLPTFPKKIGVVTSSTGAAIRDIITVIKRRFPAVEIIVYPVLVQGEKAHVEICEGLRYFDIRKDIDLVIAGRGGGSIEELWAFNEEDIARTVFNMETPVISAVGHETDFTIIDFVADLRAPTPSAAGELAVPSLEETNNKLEELSYRLKAVFYDIVSTKKNDLEKARIKIDYNNPKDKLLQEKQRLDYLFKELANNIIQKTDYNKNLVCNLGEKLDVLSPLKVFKRGYSITSKKSGNIIKTVKEVKYNDEINIKVIDGSINAKVIDVIEESKGRWDCGEEK